MKAKLDEDKAKIESPEVELTRLKVVAKKSEDEPNHAKTALATSESLRQMLRENQVSTGHYLFQMYSQIEDAKWI